MLANEYIEMSFHNIPGYSDNDFYRIIGKNGDHRFIKVNQYIPLYKFDKFYIKGVGLFEGEINKEKSDEYELYRNMIYRLSKKDFNETVMSTNIKMLYRNNNKEYKYKVNISNGSGKDKQVDKLDSWFNNENKSMIFDKEMVFKVGVLMESSMSFRNDKVYFDLTIKNPTKQNVELANFKQLSLNSASDSIQVNILDENNRYIYINLDDKHLINNHNETLKINAGQEIKLEFVYDIENFYNIINNNDNMNNLKFMLSTENNFKIYMIVIGTFISPDSISGSFEYNTPFEEVDITPLKRFN